MSEIRQNSARFVPRNRWALILIPGIGLLTLWFLYGYTPLLFSSLIVSLGLFHILNPIVDYLESRSVSRMMGSLWVMSAFVGVSCLVWVKLISFGEEMLTQMDLDAFRKNLSGTTEHGIRWAEQRFPFIKNLTPHYEVNRVMGSVDHVTSRRTDTIQFGTSNREEIRRGTADEVNSFVGRQVVGRLPDLFKKLFNLLPDLILIPYFTFFLLKDGPVFKKTLIKWIPNRYFEPSLKFFHEMNQRIRSFLQGLILDCLLVGLFVNLGCLISKVPYPVILGIAGGLLNSIPLVGPLIFLLLGLLMTVGMGCSGGVILAFVVVFVMSRVCDDLLFQPSIYGRSHKLHPVLIVSAVLVSEAIAGVWGMFLAIPVTSVLLVGLEILREISKGEPSHLVIHSKHEPFA